MAAALSLSKEAATSLDKCSHGEIALVAWGQQREKSHKSQVETTVGG